MRIIFAGTPEFAAKALEALIQSEHEVVMVLSQPDRPAGRGRKLKESAVKALAKQHHIPVYTPLTLRVEKGGEETAEVLAKMQEANADVLVVAAYGLIVPQFVLDIPSGVLPQKYPTLKAVNIHGSLLPQWRGAAPIARAIERGDKETGITLMQMDAGLDTGPMLMKRSVEITPEDTAGDLTETLSRVGAELLIEYLRDPEAFPPLPQEDQMHAFPPPPQGSRKHALPPFSLPPGHSCLHPACPGHQTGFPAPRSHQQQGNRCLSWQAHPHGRIHPCGQAESCFPGHPLHFSPLPFPPLPSAWPGLSLCPLIRRSWKMYACLA